MNSLLVGQHTFLATAWDYPWLMIFAFLISAFLLVLLAAHAAHKSRVATTERMGQLFAGLSKINAVFAVVAAALWVVVTVQLIAGR